MHTPVDSSTVDSTTAAAAAPFSAFAVAVAFLLYWASNLILWVPWSVSEVLGITLMLTISPIIWTVGAVQILRRWPGASLWTGASATAGTLLVTAIVSDVVFFGVARGAMAELLRPTTLAGYAWVVALPFLAVAVARGPIKRHRRTTSGGAVRAAFAAGMAAFLALVVLIAVSETSTSDQHAATVVSCGGEGAAASALVKVS